MLILTAIYIYFRRAKLRLLQDLWLIMGWFPQPMLRLMLLLRLMKNCDTDEINLCTDMMDNVRVKICRAKLDHKDVTTAFIWRYKYRRLTMDDLVSWCVRYGGRTVSKLVIYAKADQMHHIEIDLYTSAIKIDNGPANPPMFNTILWPSE